MAITNAVQTLTTTAALILTSQNGTPGAPNSVLIRNNDASIVAYIGGPAVSDTIGMPLPAGSSLSVDIFSGEELWGLSASLTVEIRVMVNRV